MPRLRLVPAVAALAVSASLSAQGVTSAAIQGRVLQRDSTPVAGATVVVTNTSNGQRWQVLTSATGGYVIENVEVGGPYLVEVRALGFAPIRLSAVTLALGERYTAAFALEPAPVQLAPVTVPATARLLVNAGRTGLTQLISDSGVVRLPNIARDLVSLALLSPYVSAQPGGGFSVAMQNPAFNRFQIDGGENGEVYLGREPGGASGNATAPQVLPRTISLEAVQEFQVLVAPFDVREGSFAGGVVNVVTKSGTNTLHGSVFGFFENQSLEAAPTARPTAEDFSTWQFGSTLAGPIVRDRVHYFLNADLQRRVVPDPGPLIADTAGGSELVRIGVSYASAARFDSVLTQTYRLYPGTLGPSEGHIPAEDLFGKITAQLSTNSRLELSHHYAHGDRQGFVDRRFGTYRLSSNAEEDVSTERVSRLLWSSLLGGRSANELLLSYVRLRDPCRPGGDLPNIQVSADNGVLIAGPNQVCPTTDVAQQLLELTDNLSISSGAHVITLGTHNELLHFRDPLLLASDGTWQFPSLDALSAGQARRYEIGLPGPGRRVVDFHVRQLGIYLQDRWTATPQLTLSGGLRLDVPILPDAAVTNPALEASLGINTGRLPSGNSLWSPRVAATYDVDGDASTVLRWGFGLFSGRPPYRWLGNAYRDDGLEETDLTCVGSDVPAFDPINQPTSCRSGAQPVPRTSFFDPGLKFPQSLRLSLGADRRLPGGLVGTIEVLYMRAVHEWYFTDANLGPPIAAAFGEGGRPLYGAIDLLGNATPARRDTVFGPVVRVTNRSGGRTGSLSVQLQKQFLDGVAFSAAYAYAHAVDRMSLVNVNAVANLTGTPLDGTLEDRRLRRSFFDIPHRVSASGTMNLPYQVQLSLVYSGSSGTPFTYVINGDANADGMGAAAQRNDIVYVPRVSAPGGDITLVVRNASGGLAPAPASEYAKLASYIDEESCLREQRGQIMARNSCRNGWLGFFNLRVIKAVSLPIGHRLEFAADVFNVLNLLSSRWGRYRATMDGASATSAQATLLQLVGYDVVNGRGVYRFTPPGRNVILDAVSRWQVQLGTRYVF